MRSSGADETGKPPKKGAHLMEIIDNLNTLLGDDIKATLTRGSKLRIAASTFSIYAFEALRKELEGVKEPEFIFTAPTFVPNQATDKVKKERREFHIPRPRANPASTAPSSRSGCATNSPNAPSHANAPTGSSARRPSSQTRPARRSSSPSSTIGMTRGRDTSVAHLVAESIDDARHQWIDVFSRDRADLGPAHAAARAADDIDRYGPQPPRRPAALQAAALGTGVRRPSHPLPSSTAPPLLPKCRKTVRGETAAIDAIVVPECP